MPKLIVYNIEYQMGLCGKKRDYLKFWRYFYISKKTQDGLIDLFKELNPDILALVEVRRGSLKKYYKNNIKTFSKKLHLKNIGEYIQYSLKSFLKIFAHIPIYKERENVFISKYKLMDIKCHEFSRGMKRIAIEASIYLPNKVTLILAHLSLGKNARTVQIKELGEIISVIKNPVILMGDLNTFQGRKELTKLMEKTHLKAAYEMSNQTLRYTLPSWKPSKKIDWMLCSPEIKINKYDIIKTELSDHLPLMIDFEMRK